MLRFLFTIGLISTAVMGSAHAQTAPNMGALSAQDAARINQAVKASDPNTQQQFKMLEDQMKKEGHPSSRMLEATKNLPAK